MISFFKQNINIRTTIRYQLFRIHSTIQRGKNPTSILITMAQYKIFILSNFFFLVTKELIMYNTTAYEIVRTRAPDKTQICIDLIARSAQFRIRDGNNILLGASGKKNK